MMRTFPFALLLAATAVLSPPGCLASEAPADPPCPPINMTNAVEALSSPCSDPALACSHDSGCVGAIFNFLSPQFEANRDSFERDAAAYANVTPEWVVGCTPLTDLTLQQDHQHKVVHTLLVGQVTEVAVVIKQMVVYLSCQQELVDKVQDHVMV